MGRYLCVLVLSILVTAFVGSAAPAATIQEVLNQPLDPTTTSFASYFAGYGLSLDGCWLTIGQDQIDPQTNLFKAGARPTATSWQYTPASGGSGGGSSTPNTNPSQLLFNTAGNGSDGAGGEISHYKLGNNLGGAWTMAFSMLVYDPGFTGTEIDVALTGSLDTQPTVQVVSLADVLAGTMLTWNIGGAAGEEVNVDVDAIGGESYAAGFFMGNSSFAAPEPATMSLLVLGGLASLVLKRRR